MHNYIYEFSNKCSIITTIAPYILFYNYPCCVCLSVSVCVCVCMCVCSQISGKTTNIGGSNELLVIHST